VHDTDEIVMVVEGDVEFEIDGQAHRPPHRPSPGEELLIPAHARHTVRNLGRGESPRGRGLAADVVDGR
jgi:quercetin dioxygenase-like cupin family protein